MKAASFFHLFKEKIPIKLIFHFVMLTFPPCLSQMFEKKSASSYALNRKHIYHEKGAELQYKLRKQRSTFTRTTFIEGCSALPCELNFTTPRESNRT